MAKKKGKITVKRFAELANLSKGDVEKAIDKAIKRGLIRSSKVHKNYHIDRQQAEILISILKLDEEVGEKILSEIDRRTASESDGDSEEEVSQEEIFFEQLQKKKEQLLVPSDTEPLTGRDNFFSSHANKIYIHKELLEKLVKYTANFTDDPRVRKKALFSIIRLAATGLKSFDNSLKLVKGEKNRDWKRLPCGEVFHYYLWFTSPDRSYLKRELPDYSPESLYFFLRDIREHDDTSKPLNFGTIDEYIEINEALNSQDKTLTFDDFISSFTEKQQDLFISEEPIKFVYGYPGSGKTIAIVFDLICRNYQTDAHLLFLTWSDQLSAEVDNFLKVFGFFHKIKSKKIVTYQDFIREIIRHYLDFSEGVDFEGLGFDPEEESFPIRRRLYSLIDREWLEAFVKENYTLSLLEGKFDDFVNIVTRNPDTISSWLNYLPLLYGELRAEIFGWAPYLEDTEFNPPSRNIEEWIFRRSEADYLKKRGTLSGKALRQILDLAKKLRPKLKSIWPGLYAAHQAALIFLSLGPKAIPQELRNITRIAIDEVQDLTPIEQFIPIIFAHSLAEQSHESPYPPILVLAGDEGQSVNFTNFNWDTLKKITTTFLPGSPEYFKQTESLRSKFPINQLIVHLNELYKNLPKEYRPAKQLSEVEKEEFLASKKNIAHLIYCPIPGEKTENIGKNKLSKTTSELLEAIRQFSSSNSLFINLEIREKVDPSKPLNPPKSSEETKKRRKKEKKSSKRENIDRKEESLPTSTADGEQSNTELKIFDVFEAKGLEAELVVVIDPSPYFSQIREAFQKEGRSIPYIWARTAIDRMRVAVSRATDILILLDQFAPKEGSEFLEFLKENKSIQKNLKILSPEELLQFLEKIKKPLDEAEGLVELLRSTANIIENSFERNPKYALTKLQEFEEVLEKYRKTEPEPEEVDDYLLGTARYYWYFFSQNLEIEGNSPQQFLTKTEHLLRQLSTANEGETTRAVLNLIGLIRKYRESPTPQNLLAILKEKPQSLDLQSRWEWFRRELYTQSKFWSQNLEDFAQREPIPPKTLRELLRYSTDFVSSSNYTGFNYFDEKLFKRLLKLSFHSAIRFKRWDFAEEYLRDRRLKNETTPLYAEYHSARAEDHLQTRGDWLEALVSFAKARALRSIPQKYLPSARKTALLFEFSQRVVAEISKLPDEAKEGAISLLRENNRPFEAVRLKKHLGIPPEQKELARLPEPKLLDSTEPLPTALAKLVDDHLKQLISQP